MFLKPFLTVFLITSIIVSSCAPKAKTIDKIFLQTRLWMFDQGLRFGNRDILNLTTTQSIFIISNDTILMRGEPFAIIVSVNKKNKELKLRSLKSDSTGIYVDLNEYSN